MDDDQAIDPIDEAIASVNRQFADPNREPDDEDTQAASDEDELLSDDLDDDDADEAADEDEESETQEVSWEDPSSPYHQNYLQAQHHAQAAADAEARREQARTVLENARAAQLNQEYQAIVGELTEYDPDLTRRVQQIVGNVSNQVQQSRHESLGVQHGLAAVHMALVSTLGPEQAEAVLDQARVLVKADGLESMQRMVQAGSQKSAREIELEKQNKTLALQLAAKQSKKPARTVVDSNQPLQKRRTNAADAETFDEFFQGDWNPFADRR